MTIAVDASVLVAAVADGGEIGRWAESIVADGDLVSAALVRAEASNVLRRLERVGRLTRMEATVARMDLERLEIELVAFEPFAERAWDLREKLTSYDAWYVALAEALDLPLATLDRRLARAPGPACRFALPPV